MKIIRHSINSHHHQPGFTLIEMLIIAPIVILVIGVFISAIVGMTGDVLASKGSSMVAYNVQNALSSIQKDVSSSSGFLATNSIALVSPQGYSDDTTPFHNANADSNIGPMIILNINATTSNPLSSSNDIVYLKNSTNPCDSPFVADNAPEMMNVVYFIKTVNNVSSLWRRVLASSDYATVGCSVPWQQPSCALGTSGDMCKAQDEELLDNVSTDGFDVHYYNSDNPPTEDPSTIDNSKSDSARQDELAKTRVISVSLTVTTTVAGRSITQTGTIRATTSI